MNLLDLVRRPPVPGPWQEGDNIPWHEPEFSRRMLKEHLSQSHDLASRRLGTIGRHVEWIHQEVLMGKPTRILDLGCGPGLYTNALARLGHECVGIDISPASIEHAQRTADNEGLHCTYIEDDMRAAEYGVEFGLVMLIYGEFNIFRPLDARAIVRKASNALACDGILLLEVHTLPSVQRIGMRGRSWYSSSSGPFSDKPYICLQEHVWDDASKTATIRYYILDAATHRVTPYAQTFQGYTNREYETMLAERDLEEVVFYPSLLGVPDPSQSDFVVIAARERRAADE